MAAAACPLKVLCSAVHCSGFSERGGRVGRGEKDHHYSWWGEGARKGDSVTAVSFLICRIRLWHAPSQDAGNLFICAEERGKGGQLASAIRQAGDKRYITVRDSNTNEGGSGGAHSGRTASALSSRLRWSLVRLTHARRSCNLICGRCRRRSRSSLLKETPVMSNVSRREARATPPCSLKSFALLFFSHGF